MPDPTDTVPDSLRALRGTPGRLSAPALEQALGLPAGAWRRRRLYAVRSRTGAFEPLGIRRGDFLVVEPGRRLRPRQVVVVKEDGKISVRRCDEFGELRAAPPGQADLLPFMRLRLQVVGTVLGVLRYDANRRLRCLRRARTTRAPGRPAASAMQAPGSSKRSISRSREIEALQARLEQWRSWRHRQPAAGRGNLRNLSSFCDGMDKRLSILIACLRRSRGRRLFCALAAEARLVGAQMDRVRSMVEAQPLASSAPARIGAALRTSPVAGGATGRRSSGLVRATPRVRSCVQIGFDTTRAGMV